MLSRLVVVFLPRSKCLLVSWMESLSTVILEPKKILSVTVSIISLFAMKCWDQMPWSSFSWILSFKPAFSLFSFTFIKRLFSSSSLSAIRVVSSAYMRSLIFLPAILIPACASCSLISSRELCFLKNIIKELLIWKSYTNHLYSNPASKCFSFTSSRDVQIS